MSGHRSAIRALEHESLVGIADLVSGEKDPRNLMMIFSILRVIMIEWDISNHAEVTKILARIVGILLSYHRLYSTLSSATFQ